MRTEKCWKNAYYGKVNWMPVFIYIRLLERWEIRRVNPSHNKIFENYKIDKFGQMNRMLFLIIW